MGRNNVWPQADTQAAKTEEDQPQREQERTRMAGRVAGQPPDQHRKQPYQQGNRQEPEEVGQGKPAVGHVLPAKRRPDADHRNNHHQCQQHVARQLAHAVLQCAFTFHYEPGGPQQRIGNDQPDATEKIEGRQPVKRRADKAPAFHVKAIDHCPYDDPLAEGGEQGPACEGVVPEFAV